MATDDHTTRLVRDAARRVLGIRLEEVIDRAVDRTIADEPGYTGGPVSRDDLRYHMDRTLRLALLRLVGDSIPRSLSDAAFDVGRIRAQQQVPLATVLHSFRIDLKVLWEALITEGRHLGIGTRADFLELSSLMVWETVETNTEEVVDGYQVAQGSLDEIRSAAFDQLLIDGADTQQSVDNAAQILHLPVSGDFVCLVGAFPVPRPELVGECVRQLETIAVPYYFSWYAQELRAVIHAPRDHVDIATALGSLGDHVCTIVDADGLGDVPRAIRLARTAVHGRSTAGVRHVREDWLHAVAGAGGEVADAVHAAVFGPLDDLSHYERTAILETVGDLVEHGGSIADVAERTYRHRNTVRKRLRDFTALTGLDVSRTRDLATTAIAFAVDHPGRR
ncbi:helix-turn-helix domain-containing protein [Gordonia soli]|uniref:Putative transcriptional regulator n=1 Tax=Gordonia soli NBRC 108243 TaxID=1223545 RepID=M0QGJ9_9ACTN|nr:PucR family transcriptional regulator [Gordonia soli]GAC67406.1 putative transcriptional regulator [Gordonia soli NBRC 108243]